MSLNQRKWIQNYKWLRTLYEMFSTKWATLKLKRSSQLLICCLMWIEIRTKNQSSTKIREIDNWANEIKQKKMSNAKMKKMWKTTWKWKRKNDDIYVEKKRSIVQTNFVQSKKRQINYVDISIQITKIIHLSMFEHTKTNVLVIIFDDHNIKHKLFQIWFFF